MEVITKRVFAQRSEQADELLGIASSLILLDLHFNVGITLMYIVFIFTFAITSTRFSMWLQQTTRANGHHM